MYGGVPIAIQMETNKFEGNLFHSMCFLDKFRWPNTSYETHRTAKKQISNGSSDFRHHHIPLNWSTILILLFSLYVIHHPCKTHGDKNNIHYSTTIFTVQRQFPLFNHCNLLKMAFDLSTLIVAIVDIFSIDIHVTINSVVMLFQIEQYEINNSH